MKKNKKILVGLQRTNHTCKIEKLLSHIAPAHNIDFFLFQKEDVNIENKTINGSFWNPKTCDYIKKEVPFPDIAEGYFFANDPVNNILKRNCLCTPMHYFKNKKNTNSKIIKADCAEYALETYSYKNFKKVNKLLSKYKTILIKPYDSGGGKNIYTLKKDNNQYILKSNNNEYPFLLSKQECQEKFDTIFNQNKYIVQPFYNFRTNNGNPFDIRMHMHRCQNGEWQMLGSSIRVGSRSGVVSNLSQGGYLVCGKGRGADPTSELATFLKENIGYEDAKDIINKIKLLASTVPQKLQEVYRCCISIIGFDIGVDRNDNNNLKIIELNGYPGILAVIETNTVYAKIENWKYLYNNRVELFNTQLEVLDKIKK